jgi:hypothetical protein
MAVAALSADALVLFGALLGGLLPAMAPPLPTGDPLLRLLQRMLGFAIVPGFSTIGPSEVLRNTVRPTSMPVSFPVGGNGLAGTAAHEQQT